MSIIEQVRQSGRRPIDLLLSLMLLTYFYVWSTLVGAKLCFISTQDPDYWRTVLVAVESAIGALAVLALWLWYRVGAYVVAVCSVVAIVMSILNGSLVEVLCELAIMALITVSVVTRWKRFR